MKDFFLTRILRAIGKKFDGYKTLIAGLGAFCIGITHSIPLIFPSLIGEYGLPEGNLVIAEASFVGAFATWGFGGKAEKLKKAIEVKPRTIVIKKK